MKAGKTIQEMAVELRRQNAAKRDFIVNCTAMTMDTGAARFDLRRELETESFDMTGLFHRQLGGVLNIPAKYYDKMRLEFPSLLAENVNSWLGRGESRHMVRTLDGAARAFLSDRYRRIDNSEIAEAVLPVIGGMPDARVESCEITENKMYLKVVNPRLEMDVVPGDTVQAGIVISNSEVGQGAVSVMPLIYRLVCANGMVVNDFGSKKYHVGRESAEMWELFSDTTLQADDRAFLMKLADIVRSAVDEARFGVIVDKLREATSAKISAPVASVVELTGKQYGFSAVESDGILQHLIMGGDMSLYGLSNAVTRTANDSESYERASELETAGWQIATMENRVWKELNTI
jgi:hypothetical protein